MKDKPGHAKQLHILGIAGTFMGNLGILAQALGYSVSGSDKGIYPPMSTILAAANIPVYPTCDLSLLSDKQTQILIGNALSRGEPVIEAMLNRRYPLMSGPAFLSRFVLSRQSNVIGVAGTHGKTTTSSLIAFILQEAGLRPGYLIGGDCPDLSPSAALGDSAPDGQRHFVVECDEYDTAFFDKRAKFMHYRPRICVINNLEYDHADIYPDLAAIEQQFHHLVRILPSEGLIICPEDNAAINRVLSRACYTPVLRFADRGDNPKTEADWSFESLSPSGQHFRIFQGKTLFAEIHWSLLGKHNQANALSACMVAHHIGISPAQIKRALTRFRGLKRRLECRLKTADFVLYDDFGHHPTAIKSTLAGLRGKIGDAVPLCVVLDLGSRTMQAGVHFEALASALDQADAVFCYQRPQVNLKNLVNQLTPISIQQTEMALAQALQNYLDAFSTKEPKQVVVFSNGKLDAFYENMLVYSKKMT